MSEAFKNCSKCRKIKSVLLFNKRKRTRDGFETICRECSKIIGQVYRSKNREYFKRWFRKYRKQNKAVLSEYSKKRYKKGITLFGGIRQQILERDGFKCRRCGMEREEHILRWGRELTIDHIDGKGSGVPVKEKNNHPDNLITLCMSCHSTKD